MDPKHEVTEQVNEKSDLPEARRIQTEDEVAAEAKGGDLTTLPKGYYWSPSFIGTMAVRIPLQYPLLSLLMLAIHQALSLGNCACYLGWVLPANTLTLINEDIGPDPNYTWIALTWTMCVSFGFLLTGRFSDILGRRW